MSSDYLEDVSCDENGSTVLLSMKASGDAFLTVGIYDCLAAEDKMANFYHLPPNAEGWDNARKIADAFEAWIEHTKGIYERSNVQTV